METQEIKKLPETFNKNGLPYTLIKRNDLVALFGIGGEYYPEHKHWEIVRIYRIPERKPFRRIIPAHERISSNEQFGKDGSICTNNFERADKYFQEFTKKLTDQGSRDKGGQENALHRSETTFA